MASNLASLLPPNATQAMRDIEAVCARISAVPVPLRDLWNPDSCPVELLPWLAWALSVDRWENSWSEDQKRAVVRNSLFVHRYKGTLAAVERALASLGYDIRVIEWWEETPKADAFTFRIDIQLGENGFDDPTYTRIEQLIEDTKNVRSHLRRMRLSISCNSLAYVAAAVSGGEVIQVLPWPATEEFSGGGLWIGAASLQEIHLSTGPDHG